MSDVKNIATAGIGANPGHIWFNLLTGLDINPGTGLVDLTVRARTTALTVDDRAVTLTLRPRVVALTLETRDVALTVRPRTPALTAEDR